MGEFYQIFKEELKSVLLKLFQKIERREHFQTHFMRPALPFIPKPDEDTTREETHKPHEHKSLMNINANFLNKIQ